jgi:hypothetical protein
MIEKTYFYLYFMQPRGIYLNIVEHFPKANVLTLAVNGKSLDVLYHVYVSMRFYKRKSLLHNFILFLLLTL